MKATQLIWCLTTMSLLAYTPATKANGDGQQHEGHINNTQGPLPDAVREATRRFRHVNEATAAGYQQFQGCVSGPEQGAMGVHYANFALFDAVIDVENPEVLVYEPTHGRLQLVAAEYITPAEAWDAVHEASDRPQLMGHLMHFAPGPNRYGPAAFYELHVWAWRNNPHGTFADWNPSVSCALWPNTP
jgi:hypothetical protein